MAYTNSSLVNYTRLSPNHSGKRNHTIDTVSIHCVVGQCSVETLGYIFADSGRQASSNYGIGYDGKIGMYVEEKNRSWCTSSASNDNRAITIEVASDTYEPYRVNEAAYKSLIKLLVDICKRNGIKKLLWKADKSLIGQVDKQNMTVHRWFANKSCPGDYLYNLHYQIADEVNRQLGTSQTTNTSTKKQVEIYDVNSSAKVDYFVKVTASDGLNIRQGASTKKKILGAVPYETTLKITNQTSGSGYTWGLTEYDGIRGWIALDYTQKIDIDKIANEVIQGKYGNGNIRKEKLGILYDTVQKKVNQILTKK